MDEQFRKEFEKCTERKLLALCLYGEARGESQLGMLAVGSVVRNRVKKNEHRSYHEVILKPWQFSCFNESDPNFKTLLKMAQSQYLTGETYNDCLTVAKWLIETDIGDVTAGATNYFNPSVVKPDWAKDMTMTITLGRHEFYKD